MVEILEENLIKIDLSNHKISKNIKVRLARVYSLGKEDLDTKIDDYSFIIACNTIHVGKGMQMAPLAQINDGLIDLIIAKKAGRLKLLSLFPRLFNGSHISDPLCEYRQVKEFSIVPMDDNILNIDGEINIDRINIGNTPIHVKVMEKEINVLV